MTIINPNSIAGITSVTAQADIINFYKSDGNQAGLGLNGVNFNTTAGISTFNNLVVGGTLTYEDVKNVDSVGIITARGGLNVTANTDTDTLNVSGISTFGGVVKIPTVAGTNTNSALNVLFQTATGVIDGGSGLTYNPAGDQFFVNGLSITNASIYSNGGSSLKLADANYSSTTYAQISNKVEIGVNDNVAGAFKLKEGSNEYITVDTTNSSELIKFGTAGTERLRIDSSGRVLIGDNTNPDSQLTITQAQGDCIRLRTSSTNNTFKYGIIKLEPYNNNALGVQIVGAKSDSGYTEVDIGGGIDGGYAATQIDFWTGSSVTTATGTKRVRITSAGNLLIGKTADSGKPLEVYQTGDAAIRIQNNASGTGTGDGLLFEIGSSTKDALIWNYESANMRFGTAGTERLRIDSSGRLLLGLTSSIGGNAIFQVQGSGNRKAHFHQPDTGSCIVQFTNTTTGTSTSDGATIGLDGDESFLISQKENNHIAIHTNNTERLRIGSAGQFGIGGANYGSSGQVLTSQGSGAAVQWAAAGGGWTVHKDATTAFGNNLIEQTSGLSASTDVIQIVAYRLRCANGSGTRQCVQLGTSGGYGGTYNDIQRYWVNVGSQETNRGHDQSMWSAWHGLSNPFSNTNLEFSGTITITRMGGNNFVMESQCIADRADNNNQYQILNSGRLELGGALTKIKIYTESGNNFSSGNVTIRSM